MKQKLFTLLALLSALFTGPEIMAIDHPGAVLPMVNEERFTLVEGAVANPILVFEGEDKAILRAVENLRLDFERVTGHKPACATSAEEAGKRAVIVGSLSSPFIAPLVTSGKIDGSKLVGCLEKYLIKSVKNPFEGIDEALVIVGSDRRGVVYGIYELSEQIGVSPWYDWADVPVVKQRELSIARGEYTAGEPKVRYRGIFLNDEAPCLTGWVKHTYGTNYGDHRFYERVFELILRLRGNFLWPAMWGWAFYADDAENSRLADEMGIIMGTSHHEPMARNHQEWVRRRNEYGAWNYRTNRKVIDQFFREGVERAYKTEDLITIGMRGDGDEAMSEEADIALLEEIIANQRRIIRQVTRRPADQTPQVWALYKEVQEYYDQGLRVPDDVTILLSDDNWGNVRRLPNAKERQRKGGWGMYYHVDYVGAPRNTKWLNVTPIQNLWEQMQLTYAYGVDRLWVLNVGDLKPMEYPITLFLDMAWNPERFTVENLMEHPEAFCAEFVGEKEAKEAARILNRYSKYAGRITAEMLDRTTYNLASGEWKQVTDEFVKLEAEALRQYLRLEAEQRDAYFQLILFPVQAMANLYEMYYAQAMNHELYARGDADANRWADRAEACFKRDRELCDSYNNDLAGGKWKNMMIQKHIGYTIWNDSFPADTLPELFRLADKAPLEGGFVFDPSEDYTAIEAAHIYAKTAPEGTTWTEIEDMGRTRSGVALMPYTAPVEGASLTYRVAVPADVKRVKLYVATKSTLAFHDAAGHSYRVGFEGGAAVERCFNDDLNERPENIYDIFYPTVARRVVVEEIELEVPQSGGVCDLRIEPLDPGIVFEKLVLDWGGYEPMYLLGTESPCRRVE